MTTTPDSVTYPIVGYGMAVALDDGTGTFNWATLTESGTAQPVRVLANGEDANVSIALVPKGTGNVWFGNNYANYATFTGAAGGNSPTFAAVGSDATIGFRFTPKNKGRITFDGPIFQQYTQAVTNDIASYLSIQATLTGATGASYSTNPIAFNVNDTLDASTGGEMCAFIFNHTINAGIKTNRVTQRVMTYLNGRPADYTVGTKYYLGQIGYMTVAADLSSGGARYGNAIAYSATARVTNGAAVSLLEAMELGAGVDAGGAANFVNVLKLSPIGGLGSGGGSISYNGLAFSTALNDPGFTVGIAFGGAEGTGWPIASTGKLIAITDPNGTPAKTVDYGIDFRTVACTFSTAAFASPGFEVDGIGRTTAPAFILTSGGPTITTGAGVPATTTPKGSIYFRTGGAVGSTLYVSQGGGTWNAVAGV